MRWLPVWTTKLVSYDTGPKLQKVRQSMTSWSTSSPWTWFCLASREILWRLHLVASMETVEPPHPCHVWYSISLNTKRETLRMNLHWPANLKIIGLMVEVHPKCHTQLLCGRKPMDAQVPSIPLSDFQVSTVHYKSSTMYAATSTERLQGPANWKLFWNKDTRFTEHRKAIMHIINRVTCENCGHSVKHLKIITKI